MATLLNKLATETYKDLLKINSASDNSGIDSTLRTVEDGDATASALQISTTGVKSTGTLAVDGVSTLTGAATFSSSATATNLYSTGVSNFATSGSNVGIGTTNPQHYLDVINQGGTGFSTRNAESNYSILRIGTDNSNGYAFIQSGKSGTGTTLPITFRIDSNEIVRINTSGNVGIGTTTDSGYKLDVNGTAHKLSNTTTWDVTSDERIKENIEFADLQICFNDIKNLKLKRFNYKNNIFEKELKDRTQLGFIAQDVEKYFPKSISKNDLKYNQKYEDVIIPAKFDENGIEVEKERIEKKLISEDVIKDCYGLDSSQIIWALYGAVQLLIQKVEILEAK